MSTFSLHVSYHHPQGKKLENDFKIACSVKWNSHDSSSSKTVNNIVFELEKKELWDKNIPNMVSSYFADMENVLKELYDISNKNA
ncbi:hypothetical protein YDYSY3_01560 [Paenibacillus chitinolyticus]|uniref:hypothetical protein n=1 Tax=Paenibacillus chitinolyticus TaxID=79263 RepID=UPI0026E4C03D|nr:hypothetical protein [Paenibacillus chitinolyticus]GKS09156.1 hypothetical protein YDYSY3_01560 [Paenibacillus chitinolyticus]